MPRSAEAQRKLDHVRERVASALVDLEPLFNPGAKLTFIARRPEQPDGSQDLLVTNDDLVEVEKALALLKARERE